MSLNNANSHVNSNANTGVNNNNYPFLESPGPGNNLGAGPRSAPSPMASQPPLQVNGNGNGAGINGMGVGIPMNAGQQMDVNLLYQKVMELSEVLKENREKTQGIVAGAEELAVGLQSFFPLRSRLRTSIAFSRSSLIVIDRYWRFNIRLE